MQFVIHPYNMSYFPGIKFFVKLLPCIPASNRQREVKAGLFKVFFSELYRRERRGFSKQAGEIGTVVVAGFKGDFFYAHTGVEQQAFGLHHGFRPDTEADVHAGGFFHRFVQVHRRYVQ